MNMLALPSALALTMNLILCLLVLSSNPKRLPNRIFACFVLSFAAWNLGELIMISSVNPVNAIFGVKVIFAGLTFVPMFFLHFSFVFPFKRQSPWQQGWRLFSLYLIPLAILVTFSLFFKIDIDRLGELRNTYYYGLRFHEPLIFLTFIASITLLSGVCIYWGIKNLLHSLQTTRVPNQKLQIKYLIFGMVSMAITGTVLNLFNHFLKLGWPIFFLASLYSILVSLFFAIALIKYRLLDIHVLIRGGILYSSISGLILAIYILIIKSIGETLSEKAYGRSLLVESALILALVFLFRPFQTKIADWIDRFFYMERVRFRAKLTEFARTLMELVDLDAVARTADFFISETFHVDLFGFFLKERDGTFHPIHGSPATEGMKFSWVDPFIQKIEQSETGMDLEHLREGREDVGDIDALIDSGWAVCIPFFFKEGLQGFFLLGKKRSGKDYTREEIEVLKAFASQTALAVSRALMYREMSLRDKQIMQVEKMAAIGELAAGIAHEIRNPLGIISGSAETIKKYEDPAVREEMTKYILEETNRINGLIMNLLDFSKPKEPALVRRDLREVLEKTLLLLSPSAKTLRVEIQKKIPQASVWTEIDAEQLRQAFMNIGVNALEAMPSGGVLQVAMTNAKGRAVIQMSDTGKGIPKQQLTRIFDPFFTTKEGGTGLGLSIAHRIITQHHGEITVEASEGKGSTFTITLPLERDV